MLLEDTIIDYKENKDDIEHWTLLKGDYRYERIISFMNNKNIPCTWKNVTNYIKYDKRILINSFKYLVFLEEFYKSVISRKTKRKVKDIIFMDFRNALDEYLSLEDKLNFDEMDLSILDKEKETVIQFRNSICHNKILLDRKYNNKDLEETLNIVIKILPKTYRDGFIKDINECAKRLVEKLYHIELDFKINNMLRL